MSKPLDIASYFHIANQIFDPTSGAKMNMDKLITGKDGAIWQKSLSNEFVQLTQGEGKSRSSAEKYMELTPSSSSPSTKSLKVQKSHILASFAIYNLSRRRSIGND